MQVVVEPAVVAVADCAAGRDRPVGLAEELSWFGSDDACRDYLDWCPGQTGPSARTAAATLPAVMAAGIDAAVAAGAYR